MKIDIFNHVMPQAYLELVKQHSKEPGMVKRMSNLRMLWDIEARVQMLREQFPDVQQVLTLVAAGAGAARRPGPVAGIRARRQRRHGGDVPRWPRGVPGLRRFAADEQRGRGAGGDGPRDRRSSARRASRSAPASPAARSTTRSSSRCSSASPTITTCRSGCIRRGRRRRADYADEPKSKYEIWQVLGWPFETSVAMARIVFSGLLRAPAEHAHHHPPLRRR